MVHFTSKYSLSSLAIHVYNVSAKWSTNGNVLGFTNPLQSVQSVQWLSRVRLFATPWTAGYQASLSISNCRAYSNSCPSCQWCHPTISSCRPLLLLPSIFPGIRVFCTESVLHNMWPKYWSFSFSISPSNEYSGLISFRMDWLDLLIIQRILKSLLQHHSSKVSVLQLSL